MSTRDGNTMRGGLAIFALAATLALPAMASAADGHDAHGDHHGQDLSDPVVKEHLRHFSLWNMLVPSATEAKLRTKLAGATGLKETFYEKDDFVGHGHLAHVFWALIAFAIVMALAVAARGRLNKDQDAGVLPERKVGPLLFFEILIGSTFDLMKGMMGADLARRYLPIVGTLAVYIFVMNILALMPFGSPATDNLNTNVGMALTVFFATHYAGIKAQGIGHYLQHFMGPVLALAPLMIVVEVVGHLARPLSLSLRLMGNMTGAHNVLFEFMYFQIPLVPLPVMALGMLVCVVQTMVFVILSTVYLSMAVDTGHGDDAHAH